MTLPTRPLFKLTAILLLGLSSLAWAATLTVSTAKDELVDFGNTINDCSLREAIISINEGRNMFGCTATGTYGSNDKIVLPAGTYELIQTFDTPQNQNEGNLNLRRAITIDGAGAASTIIDGFGVGGRSSCGGVINIDDGSRETSFAAVIRGVTIRRGRISDDICRSSAIVADTERGGGGIYNAENLTLEDVVLRDNDATAGPGSGGGLLNLGKLVIRDSHILDNAANFSGGISNQGDLLVEGSVIGGNVANQDSGGLGNGRRGQVTLVDATVRDNRAGLGGGGVSNLFEQASLTIVGSTISGNVAAGEGGGVQQVFGDGLLVIMNSTISGNSAGGSGAGIFANDGVTRISSATIRDNTVTSASAGGGGVHAAGAALVRLENTVVAGNRDQSVSTVRNDCSGSFESFGFNLIGEVDGCSGFTRVSDRKGTRASPLDPRLGPLADNGGPTRSHRPLAGSPVIDAGGIAQPTAELQQDQRGLSRPLDGDGDGSARFDIGAFELEPLADVGIVLADSPDPVEENGIVVYTLQIRNDGPANAPGAVASAAVGGGTVINSGSCRLDGSRGVTCLLGDVAPGQLVSHEFTVLVDVGSQTVSATAEVVSDLPDPDLSDNGASETTTVEAASAVIDIDLRDSADPVLAGERYDYTVTVKNSGSRIGQVVIDATLTGGALLERLPSGCQAQSQTGFSCTINGLNGGEINQRTVAVRAPAVRRHRRPRGHRRQRRHRSGRRHRDHHGAGGRGGPRGRQGGAGGGADPPDLQLHPGGGKPRPGRRVWKVAGRGRSCRPA